MATVKVCNQCKIEFKPKNVCKKNDFCSLPCYWKSMKTRHAICKTCNKEFYPKGHKREFKYCSILCRDKNNGWKLLMSMSKKGQKAWNKGLPNTWSNGSKSNFWNGGISKVTRSERKNFMNTLDYITWRRNIFQRDNYTCQICGEVGGNLRANHIKKYSDYKELRIDLLNGITICEKCDWKWILNREKDWESYFNFNLMTRRLI
ncbi:MAG: hypothetical protein C5B43_03475 [Verrucomicrobia bacterium]|nr:MAG: hypothetical protein C5B43_03475 [Verrucomicrobiota bacterium]